jgi:hypothetical protein
MPRDRLHPLAVKPTTRKCLSAILLFSAAAFASTALAGAAHRPFHHPVGLGKVLTTKDQGQIFGFDINQNGDDGVLASANLNTDDVPSSVEVFDQNTGKILKSFRRRVGEQNAALVDGIGAGDVALVTHYIPKSLIDSRRIYSVMNPVTAQKFTGDWTPPIKDVDVQQLAENQATTTSVALAIELKHQDIPVLFVSDIAANTFNNVIHPAGPFSLCNGPQLGQFTAANQAVLAASPDCGKRGGEAPINALVDLSTGNVTTFNG